MRGTKNDLQKRVEKYLEKPYRIEMVRDSDGGYVVWVKELPGCVSYGDTAEEALDMIKDAMEMWITTALERGKKIPEPISERKYSGRFLLRLPVSLHEKLAEMAEDEGVSLNTLIVSLLSKSLEGQKVTSIEKRMVEIEKGFLWNFKPFKLGGEAVEEVNLGKEKVKIARSA